MHMSDDINKILDWTEALLTTNYGLRHFTFKVY